MVYSTHHQNIQDLLDRLQVRYDELQKTKSELVQKTAQLVQTGKMTALGELTAGVAHEINQPLNAIKLICQDMYRDSKKHRLNPDEIEDSLTEVIDEIGKLAEIVDHMRIFTRETAGATKDMVDINKPVDGVFKLMGQQLGIRGIEIEKDLCAGLYVMGDPIKLEQVFMNLITNARDAVEENEKEKGKKVQIRTYSSQNDCQGDFVTFEISDNGRGLPEHLQEKIFEPFYTSKPAEKGTGLGLSVTAQIIEDHGGTIDVESTEGDGTTFRVVLPVCLESTQQ
jgi:signal transduction histidine kinase